MSATTNGNNDEIAKSIEKVNNNDADNNKPKNVEKVTRKRTKSADSLSSNNSYHSIENKNSLSLEEENIYLKKELKRALKEMEKYKSINRNQERHHGMRKQKQKQLPSSSWMSNFFSFSSSKTKYTPVSSVSLVESKKLIGDSDDESTLFMNDSDVVDAEYGETTNGMNDSDHDDHIDGSNDENNVDDNNDDSNRLQTLSSSKTTYEELDDMTFLSSLTDRTKWLVGLLVLQSMSSFIIARNESLLQHHTVIVQFLTMLVGAGGNAGNQAAVRVIRGLAVGNLNNHNLKSYLKKELCGAFIICFIIGSAGCIRSAAFQIPLKETTAITSSLVMIVMFSIIIGTALPLIMKLVKIDPAHSSTTIQVIMDILGVTITVFMTSLILGP